MNTTEIKSPEGFCRVSEVTKNNSDQNALYKAIEDKLIPHARLGTGHSSIVFVHRQSALNIIARREHRRNSPPVVIPAAVAQTPSIPAEKDDTIKDLKKHLNQCLECIYEEQKETNRLLGELLKIWNPKA